MKVRAVLCLSTFALLSVAGIAAPAADHLPAAPSALAQATPPIVATVAHPDLDLAAPRHVVDRNFVLAATAGMGLTIADIEFTQHCLQQYTCRELNPLIPRSRAGMYAANVPLNAAAFYLGYRLKRSGRKSWWIAPLAIIAAHGVGATVKF